MIDALGFVIMAILILAAAASLWGCIAGVAYIGVGIWFAARTPSRGFWADVMFVWSWLPYLIVEEVL